MKQNRGTINWLLIVKTCHVNYTYKDTFRLHNELLAHESPTQDCFKKITLSKRLPCCNPFSKTRIWEQTTGDGVSAGNSRCPGSKLHPPKTGAIGNSNLSVTVPLVRISQNLKTGKFLNICTFNCKPGLGRLEKPR